MGQVGASSMAHFAFFTFDAHAPYVSYCLFTLLSKKIQTALMLESPDATIKPEAFYA